MIQTILYSSATRYKTTGSNCTREEQKASGSFFFKSSRGGRGHFSDLVHIPFLNTLRHTKTKSEVLDQSLTWFGNNDRLNFFFLTKFCQVPNLNFRYHANLIIFSHPNGYV